MFQRHYYPIVQCVQWGWSGRANAPKNCFQLQPGLFHTVSQRRDCDQLRHYGRLWDTGLFGEDCEQFSITYTDEIFDVVPDACYKIDRTWTIYNECTYDPLLPRIIVPNPNPVAQSNHPDNLLGPTVSPIRTPSNPWKTTQSKINPTDQFPTNFAIFYDPAANGYQYKQIIKVIDNEDPVIENCYGQAGQIVDDVSNNNNQLWNAQYWFDPLHVSSDLCEGTADIGIVATDACSREQLSVEFQLLLDLNGDNVRETVINSTQLPPSNTVYFNNVRETAKPGSSTSGPFRQIKNGALPNRKLSAAIVGWLISGSIQNLSRPIMYRYNCHTATTRLNGL